MQKSKKVKNLLDNSQKKQGSVLVLVLILVSAMSFFAFEAMRSSRVDAMASTMLRTRLQDDGAIEAGLNLAKSIISEDDPNVDTLFDKWNYFDNECEKINLFLTNTVLSGTITDESSKFPINALIHEGEYSDSYYEYLVEIFSLMSQAYAISFNPRDFADAVRHWVRTDYPDGTLDSLYAGKNPAYSAPHKAMKSINEILLLEVPGISKDDMQKLFDGTSNLPGIKDLFSTYTLGPININTADKILIFAATKSDKIDKRLDLTNRILNYRTRSTSYLNSFWHESIVRNLDDSEISFLNGKFTYQSNNFLVRLNVKVDLGEANVTAVIRRGDFGATYVEYASF